MFGWRKKKKANETPHSDEQATDSAAAEEAAASNVADGTQPHGEEVELEVVADEVGDDEITVAEDVDEGDDADVVDSDSEEAAAGEDEGAVAVEEIEPGERDEVDYPELGEDPEDDELDPAADGDNLVDDADILDETDGDEEFLGEVDVADGAEAGDAADEGDGDGAVNEVGTDEAAGDDGIAEDAEDEGEDPVEVAAAATVDASAEEVDGTADASDDATEAEGGGEAETGDLVEDGEEPTEDGGEADDEGAGDEVLAATASRGTGRIIAGWALVAIVIGAAFGLANPLDLGRRHYAAAHPTTTTTTTQPPATTLPPTTTTQAPTTTQPPTTTTTIVEDVVLAAGGICIEGIPHLEYNITGGADNKDMSLSLSIANEAGVSASTMYVTERSGVTVWPSVEVEEGKLVAVGDYTFTTAGWKQDPDRSSLAGALEQIEVTAIVGEQFSETQAVAYPDDCLPEGIFGGGETTTTSTSTTTSTTSTTLPGTNIDPGAVTITLYNANGSNFLARNWGTELTEEGWDVGMVRNWSNFNEGTTIIYYHEDAEAWAQTLRDRYFGGAELVAADDIPGGEDIAVVLGRDVSHPDD